MKAISVTLLGVSIAAASTIPSRLIQREIANLTKRDTFNWGSVGDSFTSGVAYDDASAYDNNADNCLRTNQAWSAQLLNDNSWTVDPQNGLFQGCSGSILVDIHGNGVQGQDLIDRVTNEPQAVLMSSGGNNAHFGEIVTNCILTPIPSWAGGPNYGLPYDQDPDCTGMCCQSLTVAEGYITDPNGLGQDLLNTINDVMTTNPANSHNPFYLFIMGYIHFFNVDTSGSGTCDDWTFAPWFATSGPKVSLVLRQKMNELVEDLNNVYQGVINNWQDTSNGAVQHHVVYVSTTQNFDGHRFCEDGYSKADQWSNPDMWFWNLQYTNSQNVGDASTENAQDGATADDAQAIEANIFSGGSGSPQGNVIANGWQYRTFHPKEQGHGGIASAFKSAMQSSGMPGIVGGAAPLYAEGSCCFHVDEYENCNDDSSNLYATVTLVDNNKMPIYTTDSSLNGGLGMSINDPAGATFQGPLPWPVTLIGEHENDYIQFYYNGLSWTSRTTDGPATCSNGGWDPRDGPDCFLDPDDVAENQIDCCFPC